MSGRLYATIDEANTGKNAVAIDYARKDNISQFFMFCLVVRYAMMDTMGIPFSNPDPVTGTEEKFPLDPVRLLKTHFYDIKSANEDPSFALKNLFNKKNTVGKKEEQNMTGSYHDDYEEDRIFKEPNAPMEDDDDGEINFI